MHHTPDPPRRVIVTDINISLWHLTELLLKIAIAAVPASLLILVVYGAATLLIAVLARR
jgi:hypothetical protein